MPGVTNVTDKKRNIGTPLGKRERPLELLSAALFDLLPTLDNLRCAKESLVFLIGCKSQLSKV